VKFLLVDGHPLMRSALRAVVESLGDDVATMEAGTAGQARDHLARHGPFDAVVLELKLGTDDGAALLREMRSRQPQLPVLVFTGSDDGRDLIRAIDGGAMAFVHKRSTREDVLKALDTVLCGGIYLPEDMLTLLDSARAEAATAHSGPLEPPMEIVRGLGLPGYQMPAPSAQIIARLGLTPRQTDVLLLLLHGKPNKLIARELNLSVETIKDHVAAVLRSLNVSSRTQAVLAIAQMASSAQNGARRGLQ
jgi:DNA-binding NarL/FixJ family response regulator